MEEAKQVKIQLEKIYGDSGTTRYSGYFDTDENILWKDDTRAATVDLMRKTDAAVSAALKALKAPILGTQWEVFTYDDSPQGEKIRKDVEDQIFNMSRSWYDMIREALCFMEFGHYAFEKVWAIENGKVVLKNLAARIPQSIERWQIKNADGTYSRGIVQYIETDEFDNNQIEIPLQKLFILTNDMEGDNMAGESILRAAYGNWKYKDMLARVSGIAADRFGVGIPLIKLPEESGKPEKEKGNEMGEQMRASEGGYLTLPHGWDAEILEMKGSGVINAIESLMEFHNRMILTSMHVQFLGLGGENSGSYALSDDQSSFFLRLVDDKARYFATEFSNQVIKDIVDYNYGTQEWYPELRYSPIGEKDLKTQAETYKVLSEAGLITIDEELKKWVRPTFKLPELQDSQTGDEEIEVKKEEEEEEETETLYEYKLSENILTRKPNEDEKDIDFIQLNEKLTEQEEGLKEGLATIIVPALYQYTKKLEKQLKKGRISKISDTSLSVQSKLKALFLEKITKAYDDGVDMAKKEIDIEGDVPTNAIERESIKIDANDYATALAGEIENKTKALAKEAYVSGATPEATALAVQAEGEKTATRNIAIVSGIIAGQYLNTGRMSIFQKNAVEKGIKAYRRSEILDSRTCNICRSLDERIVKADDPMAQLKSVHTHCRGIWVPVFSDVSSKEAGIPKTITDKFNLVDGRPTSNAFEQLKKPFTE